MTTRTPGPVSKAATQYASRAGSTGSLLGVAFVVLKLTGVIDWSWWWVTAPFWAPTAALLGLLGVFLVIAGLFLGLAKIVEGGK